MPNFIAGSKANLFSQILLTKSGPHDNAVPLPAALRQFSRSDTVRPARATLWSLPAEGFATLCPEEYGINQPDVDLDSL
jgi:hypothetical protein